MPFEPRDFVAGYAAVVATATSGWQVWNSYRAKRPQVTLLLDTWRSRQTGNRRSLDDAVVRIRNREEYAVGVERLYFRYRFPDSFPGQLVPVVIEPGDVSGVPFEVPARDVVSITLRPSRPYWLLLKTSTRDPIPLISMELRTGERYSARLARQ